MPKHISKHEHEEKLRTPAGPDGLTSAQAEERLEYFGKNEVKGHHHHRHSSGLLGKLSSRVHGLFHTHEHEGEQEGTNDVVELIVPRVRCKRDGQWIEEMDATLLVPGDLISVNAENNPLAPADGYLISGRLEVVEQELTGETTPCKIEPGIPGLEGEKEMLMHSSIIRGQAEVIVTKTGDETLYGIRLKLSPH